MVLLPRTRIAEGMRVAERLRLSVSQTPISVYSKKPVTVTASLGVARVSETTPSIDELLVRTNLALHRSKEDGKNKVSFELPGKKPGGQGDGVVSQIMDALYRGDQFHVLMEPIVQFSNGQPIGYEFLSRLSIEGFEMPDDFFRLCLEHNILTLVDHRCFETCIAAGGDLLMNIRCHVNLFPSTMINIPVRHLIEAIPRNGQDKKYCIEISEQQIIGDPSYLIGPVTTLKEANILVAIDDVGFGRSCLESLILLEPDIVKIDKRCITGVSKDRTLGRQLKRILKVTESLGTEVVAEGIESNEDLETLKELGVKYGQGYLWGKPKRMPFQLDRLKDREDKTKAFRKTA